MSVNTHSIRAVYTLKEAKNIYRCACFLTHKQCFLSLRCSLSTQRRSSEKGECRQRWPHTNAPHVNEGQHAEEPQNAKWNTWFVCVC